MVWRLANAFLIYNRDGIYCGWRWCHKPEQREAGCVNHPLPKPVSGQVLPSPPCIFQPNSSLFLNGISLSRASSFPDPEGYQTASFVLRKKERESSSAFSSPIIQRRWIISRDSLCLTLLWCRHWTLRVPHAWWRADLPLQQGWGWT